VLQGLGNKCFFLKIARRGRGTVRECDRGLRSPRGVRQRGTGSRTPRAKKILRESLTKLVVPNYTDYITGSWLDL